VSIDQQHRGELVRPHPVPARAAATGSHANGEKSAPSELVGERLRSAAIPPSVGARPFQPCGGGAGWFCMLLAKRRQYVPQLPVRTG
jgi:hypothetical protein